MRTVRGSGGRTAGGLPGLVLIARGVGVVGGSAGGLDSGLGATAAAGMGDGQDACRRSSGGVDIMLDDVSVMLLFPLPSSSVCGCISAPGSGDERARICGSADRGSDFSHALGRNLLRDETEDFCRVCLDFVGGEGTPGSSGMGGMVTSGLLGFCEANGVGV